MSNTIVTIGYYFWLIPSIISCSLSTLLLLVKLRNIKDMRIVGSLEYIFAVADIVQCVPWFFGSIYSNNEDRSPNNLCAIQEAVFQAGLLTKCVISSIGTGKLAYFIYIKKHLHISKILPSALVLIFYALISFIANISLGGTEVACYNLHDFTVNKRMETRQWAYIFGYLFPIFVFCSINLMSYFLTLYCSFTDNASVVPSIMTQHSDRVATYTLISWVAYLPVLLFFLFFLFHQVNIPLYCLTGLFVSSTGIVASGYILLAPWIDKARKVSLFFFIEKLFEENEADDSDVIKLSEMSATPHSATLDF
jgi:hypothetical protein